MLKNIEGFGITSIDFDHLTVAISWAASFGGRVAWTALEGDTKVRWYPMGVTPSKIIELSKDMGDRTIGPWDEAPAELVKLGS